jgi:hypothetical protein
MNPYPDPASPPVPPAAPAASGQELVEFVRGQRQTVAYLFLGLSVLFLGTAISLGYKGLRTTKAAEPPDAAKTLDEEKAPETPKLEIADPKSRSYLIGGIAAALGFLITAGTGVYLQVRPPKPGPDAQRTEARVVVLAAGGLLGAALILSGLAFFYLWSDSLVKGLDAVDWKELKWPLGALLGVILGAGLVLIAVQPARAEERSNLLLRRLVYGSNFGVLVLLLFVALVVTNVIVTKKVPSQLDTTETGFYTLSDSTKNFLGKLTEPVTLYVILSDGSDRLTNDIRQFAYSAQDASDGKLTAKFVSPVTDKLELARLQEKYPRLGRDDEGILLTTGADEKRNTFIPFRELFETDPRGRLKGFAGENKVMRELRFLADNEQKPVIYFTQSNGELSIAGTGTVLTAGPSATQLKSFLERAYLDVRPLTFPVQNPTVPDDAAVVIVAEPQSPLSDSAVGAIRQYMNTPRKVKAPDGTDVERKGKLIVLAGTGMSSGTGTNEKGVPRTGLEGLLGEFNVRLGTQFIYSVPTNSVPEPRAVLGVFSRAAEQNPITQTLGRQYEAVPFFFPREVDAESAGNPQYKADPLMYTRPGRPTWLEDERPADLDRTIQDLVEQPAIRSRKKFSTDPRSIAVVVSEGGGGPHGGPGGAGRVLVVGTSYVFTDRYAERIRGGTPPTFDLLAVAIDWLRERPPLATTIENKTYIEYKAPEPAAVDTTRLILLPLGLGLILVTGFGAGVWVIRRK